MTKPFRVLVPRKDGSGHEFEDVSAAQYWAYMANDPAWRSATEESAPAWPQRVWHNLMRRRTPPR